MSSDGGVTIVTQDDEGRIVPLADWRLRPGRAVIQDVVERIRVEAQNFEAAQPDFHSGPAELIAFRREPWAIVLALVLIVAPHVVGAPLPPEGEHALAPLPLERQFIVAATVTSFVFWALLGTLSAFFLKRFQSA